MTLTEKKGSIFYVGLNGLLQEKRKIFSSTNYWEPASLNSMNVAAVGNLSVPSVTQDPKNDWDGYRMAAVYSENFHGGPGIRLYYHAENLTGPGYVQELIWVQSTDSWINGAKLHNPWPSSHLAATIDESTQILRLFFSSGNNTLQEAWMSVSDPTGTYKNGMRQASDPFHRLRSKGQTSNKPDIDISGVSFPHLLTYNNADIAAVSQNGSTYIYHYTGATPPTIHELIITGTPGSINDQEAYNLSSPLVASPNLTTTQSGEVSLYRPLAAANNVVQGLPEQIYVFWADKITGDPTDSMSLSGFGELVEISQAVANGSWPESAAAQIQVPLGSKNSPPNQERAASRLRRRRQADWVGFRGFE